MTSRLNGRKIGLILGLLLIVGADAFLRRFVFQRGLEPEDT